MYMHILHVCIYIYIYTYYNNDTNSIDNDNTNNDNDNNNDNINDDNDIRLPPAASPPGPRRSRQGGRGPVVIAITISS